MNQNLSVYKRLNSIELPFFTIPLLTLLLISGLAFGQDAVISGLVTDAKNNEPVPGALIVVKPGRNSTTTDKDGKYSITLPAGKYTLEIKNIGFEIVSQNIEISSGEQKIIYFKLITQNKELQTVVVSAGKFEQKIEDVVVSMDVLKPAQIINSNQTTMETAMEKVPGVTVIDGQANIRGGSGFSYGAGSRVLVLVDDLPLLTGDAGDVKWSFLPIENIEQVEVIKGASSALFGSSALNGVINMRTAYPKDEPETFVTFYSGFYDNPKRDEIKWWGDNLQTITGFNFSHREKIKQLDLVIGGHTLNDEGYRSGETEQRYRMNVNMHYHFKKIQGLNAGIAVNAQRAQGGNFLLWQDDSLGTLLPFGGIDTVGSSLSSYITTRSTIDPSITYTGKKMSHKLRMRYFMTNNKNNTEQESKSQVYYGEYLFQYRIQEMLTWSAGFSASKTKVNGDLYGNEDGTNYAGYTQADLNYQRLNMSLGYRVEQGTLVKEKLKAQQLFRAGANYRILEATHIRASYGQGFRFPSIAEKYIRTSVGFINIYPNDSITTETGWSAEIGIRQGFKIKNWAGYVDVSLFQNEYKDMMEFTFGQWGNPSTDPFFGLGFKSRNIGNTRIKGAEISFGGDGNIGRVHQSLLGGFTYIDPIQTDFNPALDTLVNSADYNVLKYRYRRMWKFDSQTTFNKITLGFGIRYYSFIENIDEVFEFLVPGVEDYRNKNNDGDWVFDADLGYQFKKSLRAGFIVKNIFNHEYMGRPADIQPMRSYTIQLTLSL